MSTPTITSAILYTYAGKYGVTREGAVLAAEPFSARASSVALARLVFVTDDGIGGHDVINALGWVFDAGENRSAQVDAVATALLFGQYATAVRLAESAGMLK